MTMARYTIPRTAHCDGGALAMAVIWCNELHPRELPGGFAADLPPGTIEITRVEEIGDNYHIWYDPVPAMAAQHPSDEDRIRGAMAEAVRHHVRTSAR